MNAKTWVVAALVLVLNPSVVARAQNAARLPALHAQPSKAPSADALRSGSGFLIAAQRSLRSADGKTELGATWPFEADGRVAAPNAAGIVARALLATYVGAGHEASRAAAESWGKARLADIAADRPVFDPDVEALVELSRVTGEAQYARSARAAFDLRHSGATGREIVERLFLVRKGIEAVVGFDAAMSLRAALAVGDAEKAREIAQALADTAARWNVADAQGFQLTSRGAVLEALVLARVELPLKATLTRQIQSSQGKEGAWGLRNTQATAYSARAMLAVGDAPSSRAAARAVEFLRATQLKSGGWGTFNDFLPEPFVGETVYEVTAEAMLALSR